jgi:hypothetical protein
MRVARHPLVIPAAGALAEAAGICGRHDPQEQIRDILDCISDCGMTGRWQDSGMGVRCAFRLM